MKNLVEGNRLPIAISIAALLVATLIGLVPVWQQSGGTASRAEASVSDLEARIAALEAAATAPVESGGSSGVDPALRQEIDLIVRGLVNQTGRVSRLKSTVDGVVGANGQVITPTRVNDEIALINRGLANLTRRINGLSDQVGAVEGLPSDVARLTQQMAIADRAFTRLATASNTGAQEREELSAALEAMSNDIANAPAATPNATSDAELQDIEAKLDAIIEALGN